MTGNLKKSIGCIGIGCDGYPFDSEEGVVNSVYAPIFVHVNIMYIYVYIDIIILVSNGCSSLKSKSGFVFFPFQKAMEKIQHIQGVASKSRRKSIC